MILEVKNICPNIFIFGVPRANKIPISCTLPFIQKTNTKNKMIRLAPATTMTNISLTRSKSLKFNDRRDVENSTVFAAEIVGIYTVQQKMTPVMAGGTFRSENIIFICLPCLLLHKIGSCNFRSGRSSHKRKEYGGSSYQERFQ